MELIAWYLKPERKCRCGSFLIDMKTWSLIYIGVRFWHRCGCLKQLISQTKAEHVGIVTRYELRALLGRSEYLWAFFSVLSQIYDKLFTSSTKCCPLAVHYHLSVHLFITIPQILDAKFKAMIYISDLERSVGFIFSEWDQNIFRGLIAAGFLKSRTALRKIAWPIVLTTI